MPKNRKNSIKSGGTGLEKEITPINFQAPTSRRDAWSAAAKEQGVVTSSGRPNLSAFLRQAADDAAGLGLKIRAEDRELLGGLYQELQVAGRNINMIAFQVNTLQKIPGIADDWRRTLKLTSEDFVEDGRLALQQHRALMEKLAGVLRKLEEDVN